MAGYTPTTFQIRTYRPFLPTEISGLKAWYDASTINQADNSTVSAWLDQSGNEAHMYQATVASQPTYQTNEINSLPVVRFDGTDFLNLTAPFDTLPTLNGAINGNSTSPNGTYIAHSNSSSSPFITIYKKTGNVINKLSNPATLPTSNVYGSNFSSDNNYLAIASTTTPFIQIYKRSGDTFTKLANPATLPAGASYYAHWSYDDAYLIVSHSTSPFITIYSVNKATDTFTKISNPASLPIGAPWISKFNTDTTYLCCGLNSAYSPFIEFYSISGGVFTKLASPATVPTAEILSMSWLDNKTVAVATGSTALSIYQYSVVSSKFELLTTVSHSLGVLNAIEYSPNKQYLAIAGANSPYFKVFSVSGTAYTALNNPASLPLGAGRGVSWGLNSNLYVSHTTSPYIQAYSFDGTTLTNMNKLNILRNVSGATIFAVVKYPANALQNDAIIISNNAGGDRLTIYQRSTTNVLALSGKRLDANANASVLSTTVANGASFYIHVGVVNYATSDAYVYANGYVRGSSLTFQTDGNTSDTDSLFVRLGGTGGEYLNGDIAEVLVFNRVLTTLELTNMHEYLSRKYNLTLA